MILFVGLGNDGNEYQFTRHNVGFMFIDYLAEMYNLDKINNKFKSSIFRGSILENDVILCKPKTMMNLSGEAVKLIKNFYKINKNNIFIFHDELDLALGKIKFKNGGGSAGHNGIKNIDKNIGNDYYRIRIGIKNLEKSFIPEKFVLSKFNKKEKNEIDKKIVLIYENINFILKKEINNFMNVINL